MIVAVILRYYKTYKRYNFIPISDGDRFSAFIGENGVGKSSVLEALDTFFNDAPWNTNIDAIEKGTTEREPIIAPIFIIKKSEIPKKSQEDKNLHQILNNLSTQIWDIDPKKFNSAHQGVIEKLVEIKNRLSRRHSRDDYYLFPVCIENPIGASLRLFDTNHEIIDSLGGEDEALENWKKILNFTKSHFNYIYVPAEVNAREYTKLESKSTQFLMGQSIDEIINKIITDDTIREINRGLNGFIEETSKNLENYEYKKPAKRQKNLTREEINSKVKEAFFSVRILNKKNTSSSIPVSQLSSGEKRKALIDIAYSFIRENSANKRLVFAVDEPEASLHTSACFDQFEKIIKISENCTQAISTTHWYGFIPSMPHGIANLTEKDPEGRITVKAISLSEYREAIKAESTAEKRSFPTDISLKSINDLTQSIISSIRRENPYNWIICEGQSEKIYFEKFFENEIKNNNLRILPAGGAKEVNRIRRYLRLPLSEDKKFINGRVLCLFDTDEEKMNFGNENELNGTENLASKRLIKSDDNIKLIEIDDAKVAPATEIEDALEPNTFLSSIKSLKESSEFPTELFEALKESLIPDAKCSGLAFDLRQTESGRLKKWLNEKNGSNKLLLAQQYVKNKRDSENNLEWVEKIKDFIAKGETIKN